MKLEEEDIGKKVGGLSLEGLAKRLEAPERENAGLRSKVASLEGSAARREEPVARKTPQESSGEGAACVFSGSEVAVATSAA